MTVPDTGNSRLELAQAEGALEEAADVVSDLVAARPSLPDTLESTTRLLGAVVVERVSEWRARVVACWFPQGRME